MAVVDWGAGHGLPVHPETAGLPDNNFKATGSSDGIRREAQPGCRAELCGIEERSVAAGGLLQSQHADTSPWVGKVIDHTRIDGVYSGGRWDLRRKFSEKQSTPAE